MRKLISLMVLIMVFFIMPIDVMAQNKKPKAKTDPGLTISKKKSKKVKDKIMKRKSKASKRQANLDAPMYWRKENA